MGEHIDFFCWKCMHRKDRGIELACCSTNVGFWVKQTRTDTAQDYR